ncbi:hypothetical protein VCCP1040_0904, partial [Vibrio cholerae CP1040(13)]
MVIHSSALSRQGPT